jgi:hypothetical protein
MSNTTSKKTLIIMVAVFVLPVVLAKIALENDWFNKASTNKGALLQPTLDLSTMLKESSPTWRLLYILPEQCDQRCENALFSINQVWLALGKESDRAQALVLTTPNSDKTALASLADYPNVATLSVDDTGPLAFQSVYVVDTLNNAMLFYQISEDKEEAVMESRNMLADIKKLLKLSRIG